MTQLQATEGQRLTALHTTGAIGASMPAPLQSALPTPLRQERNDKETVSREGAQGARAQLGDITGAGYQRVGGIGDRESGGRSGGGYGQGGQYSGSDVAMVSTQAPVGDLGPVDAGTAGLVPVGPATQQAQPGEERTAYGPVNDRSVRGQFAQHGYQQLQKQRMVKFYDHQYARLWNPAPEGEEEPTLWQELKDTVTSLIPKFGKKSELPYSLGPKADSSFFTEDEKESLKSLIEPKAKVPMLARSGDRLGDGLRNLGNTRANQLMANSNHDDHMVDADPDVLSMVEDYNYLLTLPQFAGERMT